MRNLIGIVFAMMLGVAMAQAAPSEAPDGVRHVLIESEAVGGARRPLTELIYDAGGALMERRSFVHSSVSGALLRIRVERYGPDGEVLLREQLDRDGEVVGQTIVRSDADGRVVESITFDGDGAVASRIVAVYDDAGRLVASEQYEGDVLVATDQAELDAEGRIVGSRSYDAEGNLLMEERRDPETGTTEMTAYRDGAPEATSTQRFDALGAPTESVVTAPDGTVLNEVIRTYDDRGRLVEQVSRQRGAQGLATTVARYEYEDDADGFWIERRHLDADGAVVQTLYRTFAFEAP